MSRRVFLIPRNHHVVRGTLEVKVDLLFRNHCLQNETCECGPYDEYRWIERRDNFDLEVIYIY